MRSVSVSNLPYEENFGFENDEDLPDSPLVNNKLMNILYIFLGIYIYLFYYLKNSRMMKYLSNQMMMMWFKFEEIQFQKSQKSVWIQCT